MTDPRTPTPRQVEKALEKTSPSEAFNPEGTRAEIEQTAMTGLDGFTPGQYLQKTRTDPAETPSEYDATLLPSFGSSSAVPPELLQPGAAEKLKRFEMDGLLGRGGNASVYAVRDNSLGRRIALKLLRGRGAARSGVQQRFIHEARVAAMLEHPNIVPVYDIGLTEQGRVYFLMKNVTGKSVGDAIRAARDGGSVPLEFGTIDGRIRILLKICDAMAYAHSKGFVHQDIKPDNIMLGDFGEVLVLDWGCAMSREEREREPKASFGTPAYMSPEQARQEGADERSDIYSIGATMFHMVTLTHPTWDDNPERFWEMKRAGELTPCSTAVEQSVPNALLDIARTAMAPDPSMRHQSVAAFRDELASYQAHAESLALTQRALSQLKAASGARDYQVFAAITARLEQALEMWPGNDEAADGLHAAQRAHALCALDKGDLALAQSMIDGLAGCEEIRKLIDEEVGRRALRQKRGARTLYGAAALAAALLIVSGYYVVDYFRYFGKWQPVYAQDFTSPSFDGSSLAFSNIFLDRDEPPPPRSAEGFEMNSGSTLWLRDVRERGDIRVEVNMRWPGQVDGFEIMMFSRRERTHNFAFCPTGYSCQFGGWNGTVNLISKNQTPQLPGSGNAVAADFRAGRTYRLWFQRVGEELSLFVDGKKVFSTIDPLPLSGEGLERIAIRSWTQARVSGVSVWRMGSPAKASPLIAGDALIEEGLYEAAARRYRQIAHDHAGTRIAEQALVRAYLVSTAAQDSDSARNAIRLDMHRFYPSSRYWPLLFETDARRAWNEGNFERALEYAAEALERDGMSRIALHLLSQRPPGITPQDAQRVLELAGRTKRIASLSVTNLGLSNVNALSGLKLYSLDCGDNEIESLEPLRGMPLKRLICKSNRIASIDALAGMQLTSLDISDNPITDIGPLTGIPLTRLSADDCRIRSLEPLRGSPITRLGVGGNLIESIEPLAGMPLELLNLNSLPCRDLRPLAGAPLRQLSAMDLDITSLEGLETAPLEILEIAYCRRIESIELITSPTLQRVDLSYTAVRSIEPLRGMQLTQVRVNGTNVTDLKPLQGQPITYIDVSQTSVTSLEDLAGAPLEYVSGAHTKITSLEALRGAPLQTLSFLGTPLGSLAPFSDRAPDIFHFDSVVASASELEAIFRSWLRNGDSANVRRYRINRAVLRGDARTLRSYESRFDGRGYLFVPYLYSYAEGDRLARSMGGHQVTITSAQEQAFVLSLTEIESGVWLGLESDSLSNRWCTGEPYGYTDFLYRCFEISQTPAYLLNHYAVSRNWFRATVPGMRSYVCIEWEE